LSARDLCVNSLHGFGIAAVYIYTPIRLMSLMEQNLYTCTNRGIPYIALVFPSLSGRVQDRLWQLELLQIDVPSTIVGSLDGR